jgi:uncharacterized protein YndB with AHSA1/START domain
MTQTKNRTAEELADRPLVITRVFDAPPDVVFKMWTNPKHVAQWWGPHGFTNPRCELEVRPGGAIRIDMRGPDGTVYPMTGAYREIVEPERLVFTSAALDEKANPLFELLTTVTFAEEAGKTVVKVQARVVKTTASAAQYLEGMQAGWTQSLERLASHLKSDNKPLVIERTFNAPAPRVWKALTDVEEMRQWYFDLKEFKPEVGFEFEFTVEHEGMKYRHLCKITEVIPQKTLAYTWRYKGHEGDSLVTFELFAHGDKTQLTLTHEGLETFPKLPGFARKNFMAGWTAIIGSSLKEFVEKTQR